MRYLLDISVVGSGYGLMVGLTPSDEELYNKLSPDLQRRVDQQRKQRLQLEKQADLEKVSLSALLVHLC